MSKKDPKESDFYKRFKFDKELFDSIFSGDHITDKAILYLTTLVKATLPQQKPSKQKEKPTTPPALERIKEKYKKTAPSPEHTSQDLKKEIYQKPTPLKSTQKPTFEKKKSNINHTRPSKVPTYEPTQKTVIKTKKITKKKNSNQIITPKKNKITTTAFLTNVKFILSYLNPLKKSKPEKLKSTKLDDSIKRLKEREKRIQELFDKGKGKLS